MLLKRSILFFIIACCPLISIVAYGDSFRYVCNRDDILPDSSDGQRYRVGALEIVYDNPHRDHETIRDLMTIKVDLFPTERGFIARRKGEPYQTFRLGQFQHMDESHWFYRSALTTITRAIVNYYNKKGVHGVTVRVPENQVSRGGDNARLSGDTRFTLVVTTARVGELRTLSRRGDKKQRDYAENANKHEYVMSSSPLQPAQAYPDNDGDMLDNDMLDNYVYFLNRYPNRRVDANIRPLSNDSVGVDYIIIENKPWYVWFNAANTGVPQTADWVESFGLTHTQLFNYDDTFRGYYSTDGFKNIYSGYVSYECPFATRRVRWNNNLMYNRFESAELGILGRSFVGEQFVVGSMWIMNAFQKKALFIDFNPSIQYRKVHVSNPALATGNTVSGNQLFLLPKFELSIEKIERDYRFNMSYALEINPRWSMGSNRKQIDNLGRFATNHHWQIFYWDVSIAFYLEPFFNRTGFEWMHSEALANEIALRCRGQYAFDYRLIPQMKGVAGGFNTVRAYPEALTSGDSVFLTTSEYLLHIPRLFPPVKKPIQNVLGKPFRYAPQYPGGPVDWDLIFRFFVDSGNAVNNRRIAFETDATMVGLGFGIEILFRQNFAFRMDWATALTPVSLLNVETGSNRFNYSVTFLY